jgi:threonine dehydrogenase-like Zn-dependent dehydrogenase
VLDPVLSCAARGFDELCDSCAAGDTSRCDHVTVGHISPGLQTGYCADTGGGWSRQLVAHRSQLHAVPDRMSDRKAVLVEPLACAIHAALRADPAPGAAVLVVGAGTVGALTLLALREFTQAGRITVVAKHPAQREMARAFGATDVVDPRGSVASLRRATRSLRLKPERGGEFLLGGVAVAIDCVGSKSSLDLCLRTSRGGGRVVLTGLPTAGADLTPLWFRELSLVGAYASGTEQVNGDRRRTFDLAVDLAADAPIEHVVGAVYPLRSWRRAVDHALDAGRLGTAKVVFDPGED